MKVINLADYRQKKEKTNEISFFISNCRGEYIKIEIKKKK